MASFKNLGFLPIESSFDPAMALMNVSATNSKTSSGVIGNQIFHQCLFIGAVSLVRSSELGLCYLCIIIAVIFLKLHASLESSY